MDKINRTAKYDTTEWCDYPYTPDDPLGYCWGYAFCEKCEGEGIYPNSGMWVQPDGWQICPRCGGSRWKHCAKVLERRE